MAEISDVASLAPRVESLKESQAEISGRLDGLLGKDYVRDERVQRVLEQALQVKGQVEAAMTAASTRVERLDALREAWKQNAGALVALAGVAAGRPPVPAGLPGAVRPR